MVLPLGRTSPDAPKPLPPSPDPCRPHCRACRDCPGEDRRACALTVQDVALPELRHGVGSGSQPVSTIARGFASPWTQRRDRDRGPALSMRRGSVQATDIRRTARCGHRSSVRATYRTNGRRCPSAWSCPWRPSRPRAGPTAGHSGEQGHAASDRASARCPARSAASRHRHR